MARNRFYIIVLYCKGLANNIRLTETWSKLRDFIKKSKTQKFVNYADIFLNIFQKMSSLQVETFLNFWHFSYLLWLFLICKYNRQKKHVKLQNFY